jgi:hypothetical protein
MPAEKRKKNANKQTKKTKNKTKQKYDDYDFSPDSERYWELTIGDNRGKEKKFTKGKTNNSRKN